MGCSSILGFIAAGVIVSWLVIAILRHEAKNKGYERIETDTAPPEQGPTPQAQGEALAQAAVQSAEGMVRVINESLQIANTSKNLETRRSRLNVAADRLADFKEHCRKFPFIEMTSLREVEETIRALDEEISTEEGRQPTLIDSFQIDSAHSDVIKGWRFLATLSLDTPLEYLDLDGTTVTRRRETVECDSAHGHWSPETKSLRELGFDGADYPETRWSEVGEMPLNGGAFLGFLKAWRTIVESDRPISERIAAVNEMVEHQPTYRGFAARLGADFAMNWFARQLANIPGIGPKTALTLFKMGFETLDDINRATDEELLAVPGIGAGTLKKIRVHLS
jgi:hypothetical protein